MATNTQQKLSWTDQISRGLAKIGNFGGKFLTGAALAAEGKNFIQNPTFDNALGLVQWTRANPLASAILAYRNYQNGQPRQAFANAMFGANPAIGLAFKYMADKLDSGKVEDANIIARRQQILDIQRHINNEIALYKHLGKSDEWINDRIALSIQQYSGIDKSLQKGLTSYYKIKNKEQQQATTSNNNDSNNTGGIISTAAAAEMPSNTYTPTTADNSIQQPKALSQLVNDGKIWTTGDASKAKSGVTWAMADPNSEQYQRLKASADFANSLNSYKNRTDLSKEQKEQMAIADLMALNS